MNDNNIYEGNYGWKTVWVLYQFNRSAQYGSSHVFETFEEAKSAEYTSSFIETYIIKQTYELED